MEIANIIVHDNDTGIISIDSFGVLDAESRNQVVEQAEELYHIKALNLKFGEDREPSEEQDDFCDDINESLNDGYIEINGITVSFVWSYVENVQL